MNRSTLILIFLLPLVACQSNQGKPGVVTSTLHPAVKTNSNNVPSAAIPGLTGIEGMYKAQPLDGESESCEMWVEIKKTGSGYTYVFNIQGETLKGKATLAKGDNPGENYITFEGIKWAEYEGDISNKTDDRDTTSLALPVGIGGSLIQNEITIQNTGNAMNYYVKFAACDKKYIRLVKSK